MMAFVKPGEVSLFDFIKIIIIIIVIHFLFFVVSYGKSTRNVAGSGRPSERG